jgi:dTDP-glucose pyrophosphorylase
VVKIDEQPILTRCFGRLAALDADEFIVVIRYLKGKIIDHYGDEYEGTTTTSARQREQKGLAHALSTVEQYTDDDFMVILGEFAFDDSQRAMVNDLITENLGPRYDHLSNEDGEVFIKRFDPDQHARVTVTDWHCD